jgi:hypothetical protein
MDRYFLVIAIFNIVLIRKNENEDNIDCKLPIKVDKS